MRFLFVIFTVIAVLSVKGQATVPTLAPTGFVSSDIYCSTATLSWVSGNGVSRIVIASKGSAVTSNPAPNNFYIGNPSFGSGYDFGGDEYVVYNGTGSTVDISNLESNVTYHFKVIEYNGGGVSYAYLVSGSPVLSFTTDNLVGDFTVDDTYQCLTGNTFSHTSTTSSSSGATISYRWNFDDGNTSTDPNPSHSFSSFGIYDVRLTLSSTGCEYIALRKDTVAPKPVCTFTLDPNVPQNSTPQGLIRPDGTQNRFWFINESVSPSLGGTISNTVSKWSLGDGTTAEARNTNKSYAAPGIYDVKLVVNNTQNDKDFCQDSFEIEVEVKASPIDTALLELDTAQCLAGNFFEFSHNTPDLTVAHSWSFGDGGTAIGSAVSHTYAADGTYTVKLEATDLAGGYAIYEREIIVATQPDSDFSGLDLRYCLGEDSAVLIPAVAGGIWQGADVSTTGGFNPINIGQAEVRYILEVDGCVDSSTQFTEVYGLPVFEIGSDTTICAGSSFTKLVPSTGAIVAWSTGGADTTIIISQAGLYWASKTLNDCSYNDTFEVTIITAPEVSLGNDSTLCGDGVVNIAIDAAEATYTWNDGYPNNGDRMISSSGKYALTVTNKCGSDSDAVDLTFLTFKCDIFIPTAFTPNEDQLNPIFRPTGNVEILNLTIYSLWGEQVYYADKEIGWDGTYQNKAAQAGCYLYIIEYSQPEGGSIQRKIAKGEVYLIR